MEIEPNQIWDDIDKNENPHGAEPREVDSWEKGSGVSLPKLLRQSLLIQNGGKVRYSEVVVRSLKEITPMDEEFWEDVWCEEEEFQDKRLVFAFGESEEGEALMLLNYNANGPEGIPLVYSYSHDPCEVRKEADSLDEFLAAQLDVSSEPAFIWPEVSQLGEILFQEHIVRQGQGGWEDSETLVEKVPGRIRVYRRETSAKPDRPPTEELVRMDLLQPLRESDATIWSGGATHRLRLQSASDEDSPSVRSVKMADGKWKNGPCNYECDIESTEKDKLRKLRASIFGRSAY